MTDHEILGSLSLTRRSGLRVYVVSRANGNSGPFAVFRDGYTYSGGPGVVMRSCQCGDLADTLGHYTNHREAERVASYANAQEAENGSLSDYDRDQIMIGELWRQIE